MACQHVLVHCRVNWKQICVVKLTSSSKALHDGVIHSDTQLILPGLRCSNNSQTSQTTMLQYNSQVALPMERFSCNTPAAQSVEEQSNTQAALPKNKVFCSMTVRQTITKESQMQAVITKNKPCCSPLQNGLVQSNTQVILPSVAFSDNSTMSQNVPVQNNILVAVPNNISSCTVQNQLNCGQQITQGSKKLEQVSTQAAPRRDKFSCKMMVPQTSAAENDMKAPLTKNKPCSFPMHDDLVQSNTRIIIPGVAFFDNSTTFQNVLVQSNILAALPNNNFSCSMPSQDPQNQPKYVLVIGKTTRQITQASKALEQNNTKATSSTLKFSCKMKVPQASVEESAKQVPLPKNKPRSVSLHDGLVQSTTHVSLPDVAFSENSTASQNVLLQNNTLASSPRYKFTCSMKVPRTITKESNMQAPLPKNKPCGLLFHDGLSPSNPQVILPGVASSDNSLMFQNIPEQNNVQAALPKNKFSCSMPSQDPQNHLKCVPLLLKPTQQITQASKESTELVSLDIAGKFQQWRTTLSTHPVDRRDGQDVKENKSLKSGETPSESDCVSLSLSNACSSNSEKNISIMKPHVDNNILQLKASTKDVIENEEVSYEQEVSSITGFDTDEVLVTYECIRNANKYIDVVCHVCASVVSVEKMLSMHLLFGHLKCKNCDLEVAGCSMMKTCFYRNSFCRGNKQQGKHDFTVWCSDVIEYILYHLKKDLIIKNFCKYDRNIPVCDNDLYSELQDYVGKLAILRKCCPWNSALHECDQYILSQKMSRKIYSVSNANTHPTDSAIENRRKADLLSFQDSRSLELICKKNETVKDFERDKAEFVRVTRKRGGPCLAVRDWDFPKDKRYLKISITGKHFSCPEECPECYFAICPSRFIMKVNDFTLKYTCVECHLPIFFVFEPDEEKYKKRKRVK